MTTGSFKARTVAHHGVLDGRTIGAGLHNSGAGSSIRHAGVGHRLDETAWRTRRQDQCVRESMDTIRIEAPSECPTRSAAESADSISRTIRAALPPSG